MTTFSNKITKITLATLLCTQTCMYALPSSKIASEAKKTLPNGISLEIQTLGTKTSEDTYKPGTLSVYDSEISANGVTAGGLYSIFKGKNRAVLRFAKTLKGSVSYETKEIGEMYVDGTESGYVDLTSLSDDAFIASYKNTDQTLKITKITTDNVRGSDSITITQQSIPEVLVGKKIAKLNSSRTAKNNVDLFVQTTDSKVYALHFDRQGLVSTVLVSANATFVGSGIQTGSDGNTAVLEVSQRLRVFTRKNPKSNFSAGDYITDPAISVKKGTAKLTVSPTNEAAVLFTQDDGTVTAIVKALQDEAESENFLPTVTEGKSIRMDGTGTIAVVVKTATSTDLHTRVFGSTLVKAQTVKASASPNIYFDEIQLTKASQIMGSASEFHYHLIYQDNGLEISTDSKVNPAPATSSLDALQIDNPLVVTKNTGTYKTSVEIQDGLRVHVFVLSYLDGKEQTQMLLTKFDPLALGPKLPE